MSILSQLAVLILIVLVGFAFLALSGKNPKSRIVGPDGNTEIPFDVPRRPADVPTGTTLLPPVLYIDQLDPRTMQLAKRIEVADIPETGLTISRPNAQLGNIKLDGSTREAYSVSQEQVKLGADQFGIFIQDYRKPNRMRHGKTKQIVDEIAITDGLIVYLGLQPLRFTIPDFFTCSSNDEDTKIYNGNAGAQQTPPETFGRRHNVR
jgi:hypothetical protein